MSGYVIVGYSLTAVVLLGYTASIAARIRRVSRNFKIDLTNSDVK